MKKKTIEKIPYLTLPKTMKKPVKYIGVTAFFTIAGEEHLFLEVYWNQKDSREVPIVRIVLTQKDFGNYFPEADTWTRGKIELDGYYNHGFIWSNGEESHQDSKQDNKENILYRKEDLSRIRQFCKEDEWKKNEDWWRRIYDHESDIVIDERRKIERRKYERRQQALQFRRRTHQNFRKRRFWKEQTVCIFEISTICITKSVEAGQTSPAASAVV